MRRNLLLFVLAVAVPAFVYAGPIATPRRAWYQVESPSIFAGDKCVAGIPWCSGTANTAEELAQLELRASRYNTRNGVVMMGGEGVAIPESLDWTVRPKGAGAINRIHELAPGVVIGVRDRVDLTSLPPDPTFGGHDGCAHGTISHFHDPDLPAGKADTRCDWPTIGMCSGGENANYLCMDDGDCPSSTCLPVSARDLADPCIPTVPVSGDLQPGDPGYGYAPTIYNSWDEVRATMDDLRLASQINKSAICDGEPANPPPPDGVTNAAGSDFGEATDCSTDLRALCNGAIDCSTRRVIYYGSDSTTAPTSPSMQPVSGVRWDLRQDICQWHKAAILLAQPYYAGLPTDTELLFQFENKAGQDLWQDLTRYTPGACSGGSNWGHFLIWETAVGGCTASGGKWFGLFGPGEWEAAHEGLYQKLKAQIADANAFANRYDGHVRYGFMDVPSVRSLSGGGVSNSNARMADPLFLGDRSGFSGDNPAVPLHTSNVVACNNGVDDDGDGGIDRQQNSDCTASANPHPCCTGSGTGTCVADTGCTDTSDTSESTTGTQCDDGVDNDGDGEVDSHGGVNLDTPDSDCTDASDNDEFAALTAIPSTAAILYHDAGVVYAVDADGSSNLTAITGARWPGKTLEHVASAHDRNQLALNYHTGNPVASSRLVLLDIAGRTVREPLGSTFYQAGNGGVDFDAAGRVYFAGIQTLPYDAGTSDPSEAIANAAANDIWRMQPDGSELTNLTSGLALQGDADVSVSEDGTKITWASTYIDPPDDKSQIWIADADGSNAEVVYEETDTSLWLVHDPEFSPDNSQLVFSREDADASALPVTGLKPQELYRIDADGTNLTQLTTVGTTSVIPDWAGTKILFQELTATGPFLGISTVDDDGTDYAQLSNGKASPKWIPTETTVAASAVASKVQGSTCVAPCVVHFDGTGTTDTDHSNTFRTHLFEWDFGDSGGTPSTWDYPPPGTDSRNTARGAVAGHAYYAPGTYNATLTVTAPDGDTAQDTVQVVVADPDTVFAGTATVCIAANSTPSAGSGGCPSGAAVVNATSAYGSADFDQALAASTCDIDNSSQTKRRCMFKGGDTFTSSALVSATSGGGSGPGLITSYGTGQALVEGPTTDTRVLSLGSKWQIDNIEIHSNHCQSPGCSTGSISSVMEVSGGASNVTVSRVVATNYPQRFVSVSNSGSAKELLAFVDNTCASHYVDSQDASCLFLSLDKTILLGNLIDQRSANKYAVRIIDGNYNRISNNYFWGAPGGVDSLAIRPCGHTGCDDDPADGDHHGIVSRNWFDPQNTGAGLAVITICETNDCNTQPLPGGLHDYIFEENFVAATAGSSPTFSSGLIAGPMRDVDIRNNIIDATGMVTSGSATARIVNVTASSHSITQSGVRVFNNTFYAPETAASRPMTMCGGSSAITGGLCYGNLSDVRGMGGAKNAADGGNWTAADNLFSSSNPFVGTVPAQGSSDPDDFKLGGGSAAIDAGFDFTSDPYLGFDFGGQPRPQGAGWDAGAWEVQP